MAGWWRFYMCLMLWFVTKARAYNDLRSVINQVNLIEKDVNEMKIEVPRFEARAINKMGMLELVLRSDLIDSIVPQYIHAKVQQAFSKILGDQSESTIFTSHLRSEVRDVKHEFNKRLRQLRIHMETEREKQKQEVEQMRLEVVNERIYYDRQVTYLQAELNNMRYDVGRLEQEVSYLMRRRPLLNETRGVSKSVKSETCDCVMLADKINQERVLTNQMFQDLEKNISSLKSVIGDKSDDDDDDDDDDDNDDGEDEKEDEEEEEEDSSEEKFYDVTNELGVKANMTAFRLEQLEEETRQLTKNFTNMREIVVVKLQDISVQCKCVNQISPSLPQTESAKMSQPSIISSSFISSPVSSQMSTRSLASRSIQSAMSTPKLPMLSSTEHRSLQQSPSTTSSAPESTPVSTELTAM